MIKKDKMHYKYITVNRANSPPGHWLEFHTGWDKTEVKNGAALCRAMHLGNIDARVAKFIKECENDIDVFELQRIAY